MVSTHAVPVTVKAAISAMSPVQHIISRRELTRLRASMSKLRAKPGEEVTFSSIAFEGKAAQQDVAIAVAGESPRRRQLPAFQSIGYQRLWTDCST